MMNHLKFGLQDPSSYVGEILFSFYDFSLFVMYMIIMFLFFVVISLFKSKFINKNLIFNETGELIWTCIPMSVLIIIGLPSLKLLYVLEEGSESDLCVKAVGHQWYWSYEYVDFLSAASFDSFMKKDDKLSESDFRILDVTKRLTLPIDAKIRLILTSTDVIHSWAVPALGVKLDAVPGRLNQTFFESNKIGLFFGQCSEICGAMHSFMPICVQFLNFNMFKEFLVTSVIK